MEKKYQVFVSSTYEDLQEERKKVMEALLQMNCFPVGMEYFNASDFSQWEVIKSLIRECDYYVLIVAGRYGSIEEESGKSYTQKEFEYAIEQGIPVVSFVHKNSRSLPGTKIESNPLIEGKLDEFKSEVKKRLCKLWENSDELPAQIVLSLNSLIKTNPRMGWVKANEVSSAEANEKLLKLNEENIQLKKQIEFLGSKTPDGTDIYKRGEDMFEIHVTSSVNSFWDENSSDSPYSENYSWNQIFLSVCTILLQPVTEHKIKETIEEKLLKYKCIDKDDFQTILIQLMALKLIQTDILKSDAVYPYWILTSYGREEMVRLKAIKK